MFGLSLSVPRKVAVSSQMLATLTDATVQWPDAFLQHMTQAIAVEADFPLAFSSFLARAITSPARRNLTFMIQV